MLPAIPVFLNFQAQTWPAFITIGYWD